MTEEIARLGIAVDSRGVKKGATDLDSLATSAAGAERETSRLSPSLRRTSSSLGGVRREVDSTKKSFSSLAKSQGDVSRSSSGLAASTTRLIAPLATLTAGVVALNTAFGAVQAFEKYEAQLVTATGSVERASLEMGSLNQIASRTPFQLSDVVEGFVRLKNLGLDPSEAALISYGNTASSMGKSLNQFIEAVADATVGEFERLKEFGIKARSEGDNVSFTFAGVTTSVQNSAKDIESYLRDLGNTEFAGAMERRSEDIEVAFSNLGIASDRLANKLATESGLVGAAKKAANALTSLFNTFVGAPRSVDVVESEIDRVATALRISASPRSGASLRSQLKDLREELQLARTISSDSKDVERAIESLDQQINSYRETLAEFGKEPPQENIQTRRGSRTNPAFERYNQANQQLEAALNQRQVLLDRKAELDAIENKNEDEEKVSFTGLTEDQLEGRLERVRASLHTEEQEIAASFVRRQEVLADYLASNGDFETEYRELTLSNVEQFNQEMLDLDQRRLDAQVRATERAERQKIAAEKQAQRVRLQAQQAYAALASSIIYAAFGESKDARRAQALISTYTATNNALATDAPWPIPQTFAAAAFLAGIKNVTAIEGVSIGGGGGVSAPSPSASIGNTSFNTPVIAQEFPVPDQRSGPTVNIYNPVGLDEEILAQKITELYDRDFIDARGAA